MHVSVCGVGDGQEDVSMSVSCYFWWGVLARVYPALCVRVIACTSGARHVCLHVGTCVGAAFVQGWGLYLLIPGIFECPRGACVNL